MPRKMIDVASASETKNKYIPFVAAGLLIVLVFLAFYWLDFKGNKKEKAEVAQGLSAGAVDQKTASTPGFGQQLEITKSTGAEINEIATKVSKHIVLPSGDVVVFIVSDPELLLKEQPTLTFLNKGDYVLKYADRAIFYDPRADLIKDVIHFSQENPVKK